MSTIFDVAAAAMQARPEDYRRPSRTIEEFSTALNDHWNTRLRGGESDISIPALGLTGEAGEVVEFFKKHIRDGASIARNEALALEFGDVLHYWCRLVYLAGYTPAEIMELNERKLAARRLAKLSSGRAA